MRRHFELAVLCAKSEELAAVQKVFRTKYTPKRDDEDLAEQIFEIETPDRTIRLVARTCGKMGHMAAAFHTAGLVSQYKPSFVFFVGTAASLDPKRIQLGDVVVPRKAIHRVYDKITEEGSADFDARVSECGGREKFFGENVLCVDSDTIEVSEKMQGALSGVDYDAVKSRLERGNATEIVLGGEKFELRDPEVHLDDDIFSCGMVVDSITYRQYIQELAATSYRKARTIDMESYGFYSAIQIANRTGYNGCEGVMIRGISDYAGRKGETEERPVDWKSKSVMNAALVVDQIISDLYARSA